jgi:hypothetical protein
VINRSEPGIRPDESAGGLAETGNGRGATVISLIRRCGRIVRVTTHRGAKVAWHSATQTLRPHGMDQSGSFPNQLRLAFEDLGPTFVKLGQLLSERSDITPPAVQQELSKLQDHAPSIPRAELLNELARGLGPDPSQESAPRSRVTSGCLTSWLERFHSFPPGSGLTTLLQSSASLPPCCEPRLISLPKRAISRPSPARLLRAKSSRSRTCSLR